MTSVQTTLQVGRTRIATMSTMDNLLKNKQIKATVLTRTKHASGRGTVSREYDAMNSTTNNSVTKMHPTWKTIAF